jgi:alkylation response protein AidB-like acyl-CoA dehydrogenase
MALDLPEDDLPALRAVLRSWIREAAPAGLAYLTDWRARADLPGGTVCADQEEEFRTSEHALSRAWEQTCLDAGLVCPGWPREYGGRGWGPVQLSVLDEECFRAGVPRVDRLQGESMVGPSIMHHGTDVQKAELLPKILSGEHRYCQGFSEPSAGSDLAAAALRGELRGEELVLTGQKVWTSRYTAANMIFVLCRTDPDAPKHQGLSYVLADFGSQNGMDVRPTRQITGARDFAEVFFDGARAPLSNVIGGLGNGWKVVQTTLANERVGSGRTTTMLVLARLREFEQLADLAVRTGRARDPVLRQRLAWAYSRVQVLRFTWLRILGELSAGRDPGPAMTTWKLFWSEYHTALGEIAVEVLGAAALVRPSVPVDDYAVDQWQQVLLASRSGTIYAGTSEIQRNIIGESVLGLPREPKVLSGMGERRG